MNKIFILKADKPQHKLVPWHMIKHLKDDHMNPIDVAPTPESIEKGHLEWIIPDTAFNRSFIHAHYRKYQTIEAEAGTINIINPQLADDELKLEKEKNADLQRQIDKLNAVNCHIDPSNDNEKLSPKDIVKLKTKIKEKLTALGVKNLPEKATLKEWEELLKKHVPEK